MIEVWTDGAASENGSDAGYGGWAYVLKKEGEEVLHANAGYVPPKATNNICELTAIIQGCRATMVEGGDHEIVNVYSDSAYIINCYIQKWWIKWKENGWINSKKQPVANRELWEKLIPFFEKENFNFIKVKGHATNKYNNMVDEMAVGAKNDKRNYTTL